MLIIFSNLKNIFSVSSLIQKLRKSSCLGSLTFPALWPFAEGLFDLINYLQNKEGFSRVLY